jgi:uncharacterized protein YjlB
LIWQRDLRSFSKATGGKTAGAMASTTTSIIIRASTKPSASRGSGEVQFGGPKGRIIIVKAGDVAILPAGTGHQCLRSSDDFLVVGACPPSGTYDECTSHEDRKKALATVPRVARPRKDPVYGNNGPLLRVWSSIKRT